ncbi:palmitoyl-protein thioesterase 1 [Bombus huntii]|uniref:palmitoyl-protein thioesterase 1 n=1 Tax=Bombus huntii TaxID=85661 RepID=UPI0021A99065|nr:palmitoyl-protein thioesterase 1 [Bombus huntii]XP_050470091.1 palmitoyl-protein thioesterase 1 [Bombus huntii]XP_050470093.1 palmitoyl-protein thioesterase 1 [Bombus huntii]XP_050470094.1 palmitoyl-protein thioesterase 1 [Bombus huntii]XP_050470095.1 palmitoyl-protein thioesterase 1 [Bombus huntii]XP_050470096.1 palmitoyl-protein thioesterase 1 [Bombus huntii]XP_050470097.1 palmitoyl-protein thioesterase 1 [Bombus huntii]XP_050470098.1 palmitoyl-protein thioesterase 1 [Bombus huntii]
MGKYILLLFFFSYIYQFDGVQIDSPPVVLWHGMGDSCCFSFSLGGIKKLIENRIPNIYVYSIRLGNNEIEDVEHSYFGNINEQIQEVCQQLSKNERLKNGYNAIGFSQGAQFLRAVIQRCPNPPVKNFISLGGQHQGVFGLPNCGTLKPKICNYITRIIKYGAYLQAVQGKFIQATYWHDPYQEEEYKKKSMFMADINNERYINETYKENLQRLRTMVLVKFTNDTIVKPIETEMFGFYKPGQGSLIQTLEQSDLYREDRLGLKMLHDSGRIHFLNVHGNHLQFTEDWFVDNIIKKYLL